MNCTLNMGLLCRASLIVASFFMLTACQKLDFGPPPEYLGVETQASSSSTNARDYAVATSNVLSFVRKDIPGFLVIASKVLSLNLNGTQNSLMTTAITDETADDDFIFFVTLRSPCEISGEVTVTPALNAVTGITTFIFEYIDCVEGVGSYNGGLLITTSPATETTTFSVIFEPKNLSVMRGDEHSLSFGTVAMRFDSGPTTGLPLYIKFELIQEDYLRGKTYLFENVLFENGVLSGTAFHSDWGFMDIVDSSLLSFGGSILSEEVSLIGGSDSGTHYSIIDRPNDDRLDWTYQIDVDADGDNIYESIETILGASLFAPGP